jgi:hypothetical protein
MIDVFTLATLASKLVLGAATALVLGTALRRLFIVDVTLGGRRLRHGLDRPPRRIPHP